jgi:hypothetical protein
MSVEIHRGGLVRSEIPHGVNLWNIAPRWPGRSKAKLTNEGLSNLLELAFEKTVRAGFLLLWVPAIELHRSSWAIWEDARPWRPVSTLVSGMGHSLKIGILYSKDIKHAQANVAWGYHCIHDFSKRSGPTSSESVKWVLDRVLPNGGGIVVDPYANRQAIFATYCRRYQIGYLGYIRSKKGYEQAQKVLAQVELPLVQTELL